MLHSRHEGLRQNGVSTGEKFSLCEKKKNDIRREKICNGVHFPNNSNLLTSNLTHLVLSDCGLTHFPPDVPNSDSIIEIDLSKNSLTDLPESFTSFKKLRVLDLSHNLIAKVPNTFYTGLHLIKRLNLSGNNLVTFQKAPCCLPVLQHLDLSSNKLVAPPPWLIEEIPSSLVTIDLSNNPCFQLCPACPEVIEHLHVFKVADNIRTLKLQSCGFRGGIIERYLSYFRHVSHLDIGNCKDRKAGQSNFVPDMLSLPSSITDLTISSASLACLPKPVTSLPHLRNLNVSGNIIQWLPPAIQGLKTLVVLRAESSKIFLLPPEMNELPALKELHLSNNELSSSDGFENLASLEVLDLYGNQFITVPNFQHLSRLRAFDFCQNYIEPPKCIDLGKQSCSYESLKECLRSKYLLKRTGRLNGSKDFPVVPDDCDSEFEDYSDGDDLETSDDGYTHTSEKEKEFPKEVWDLDSDENFDPNELRMETVRLREETEDILTGELPYEVKLHPHYFAPYRPVTPVPLPAALPPPVEGQFDD